MLAVWQFALSREICVYVLSCILALFRQISETNFTENTFKYQITFQITPTVMLFLVSITIK